MIMNPLPLNPKYNKYSIKTRFTHRFLRSLKQVNIITRSSSCNSSSSRDEMYRRSVEIKYAANMCMAATVGSKRAWSRAMLIRKINYRRRRRLHALMMRRRRSNKEDKYFNINGNPKNDYDDKVDTTGEISETEQLREIVPGGEGLDMGSLLEETAHYIKCLTTQVQVMKDILNLYSS